jgi:hypothetical protein
MGILLLFLEVIIMAIPSAFPNIPQDTALYIVWSGAILFVITAFYLLYKHLRNSNVSGIGNISNHFGAKISQKMSGFISFNNSQQINIEPDQRSLTDSTKTGILNYLKILPYKKFTIVSNHSDTEAFKFSMKIKEFLIENGFEYEGFVSSSGITGGNGAPEIHPSLERFCVLIGANVKTNSNIEDRGGLRQGMGKL